MGCIIEIEGRPLALGYNGSLPGDEHCDDIGCLMHEGHCIRTVHAEANAICWAAKKGIALEGASLYVVGWEGGSCHRCAKLAWATGIVEIVTEDAHGNVSIRSKLTKNPPIPPGRTETSQLSPL